MLPARASRFIGKVGGLFPPLATKKTKKGKGVIQLPFLFINVAGFALLALLSLVSSSFSFHPFYAVCVV